MFATQFKCFRTKFSSRSVFWTCCGFLQYCSKESKYAKQSFSTSAANTADSIEITKMKKNINRLNVPNFYFQIYCHILLWVWQFWVGTKYAHNVADSQSFTVKVTTEMCRPFPDTSQTRSMQQPMNGQRKIGSQARFVWCIPSICVFFHREIDNDIDECVTQFDYTRAKRMPLRVNWYQHHSSMQ